VNYIDMLIAAVTAGVLVFALAWFSTP